ncbi:hypothetical protein OF83DRAFT_422772 [Amylostereum chailletii]|nr:hypothetical protein OF83DRAFT_422772 [Amylostereum chailletii]
MHLSHMDPFASTLLPPFCSFLRFLGPLPLCAPRPFISDRTRGRWIPFTFTPLPLKLPSYLRFTSLLQHFSTLALLLESGDLLIAFVFVYLFCSVFFAGHFTFCIGLFFFLVALCPSSQGPFVYTYIPPSAIQSVPFSIQFDPVARFVLLRVGSIYCVIDGRLQLCPRVRGSVSMSDRARPRNHTRSASNAQSHELELHASITLRLIRYRPITKEG